jgi:phospholipase/carboxylesterase
VRHLIVVTLLAPVACVSCMPPDDSARVLSNADASRGELAARPQLNVQGAGGHGLFELEEGTKPALLYVPQSYRSSGAAPLVIMLHGAGGTARNALDLVQEHAERLGIIVVAPQSRLATWDMISGRRYGPDVIALNGILEQVFARYSVDPQRVAIAGFSDGASYALSLGVTNGELFSSILAFSPGFMQPTRSQGEPRIFISHGVQDSVLSIDQCSRRLVPQLRQAGYDVDYREFPGGHSVSEQLARSAFEMLS